MCYLGSKVGDPRYPFFEVPDEDVEHVPDKGKEEPHRPPRPRPPFKPGNESNPCNHPIDAITVIRKEVFIFIGDVSFMEGITLSQTSPGFYMSAVQFF